MSTDVALAGALPGDLAFVSLDVDVQDVVLSAVVTAPDTVTVTLLNNTVGVVNLASATLFARVSKPALR